MDFKTSSAQAGQDATIAAERARVTVRPLDTAEVSDAATLLESIWGSTVAPPALMVALAHSGACVAGAFQDSSLVGVCVGYFAQPVGEVLHSHVAGVRASHTGRGVGRAMKLYQRAWCLEQGITRMTWTFDPLVSRNAAFNVNALGVDITEYLKDFYGQMTDGVNAGQGSDRLLASWQLAQALTHASALNASEPSADDQVPTASALLTSTTDGRPHPHIPDPAARYVSVAVPPNVESLRRDAPIVAAQWRGAVRGALAPLIDSGWRVTGFDDHRYLLEGP